MTKVCKRGHEMTPENIGSHHRCKLCRNSQYKEKRLASGFIPQKAGEKVESECPVCGKMFSRYKCQTSRNRGKYCSRECFDVARKSPKKYCIKCGGEITVKDRKTRKYCSPACYGSASSEHNFRECRTCGKIFHAVWQGGNRADTHSVYCSVKCWGLGHRTLGIDLDKYPDRNAAYRRELADNYLRRLLPNISRTPAILQIKRKAIAIKRIERSMKNELAGLNH